MSRLAKKPIPVPAGVTIAETSGMIVVKGPKGSLEVALLPSVSVSISDSAIQVSKDAGHKQARANLGTVASLLKGAIEGVTNGYGKKLEIEGVGYKAALEGRTLVLSLGYVNPVKVPVPDGVEVTVEKNVVSVSGASKDLVGRTAAYIRSLKKPEPYKGKGIKYQGEVIVRKVGKKAAAGGSA